MNIINGIAGGGSSGVLAIRSKCCGRGTPTKCILNAHKMCTVGKEFRLKGLRVQV